MPGLIEEVQRLIEAHPEADYYELQCLRLAADLLALVREVRFGETVPESVLPRMTIDEYVKLPDRFELIEGRVHPKHWDLYAEGERKPAEPRP